MWGVFRNHRAEWLEKEIQVLRDELRQLRNFYELQIDRMVAKHQNDAERLVTAHRDHVAAIDALNLQLQYEAMRELAATKKAHGDELQRAINERDSLWDEYQRTLRLVHPKMQDVELPKERTPPPSLDPNTETGTPWQRVLKRELKRQEQDAAAAVARKSQGESNGSTSEGRVDAPLGGSRQSA